LYGELNITKNTQKNLRIKDGVLTLWVKY